MITIFLMTLALSNSFLFIAQWAKTNKLTGKQSEERDFLLSLEEQNSDKNFLVVGSSQNSNHMVDTYMQNNNVYQIKIEDLKKLMQNIGSQNSNGKENSSDGMEKTWDAASNSLSCIGSDQYYSDLDKVDYIIYDQYSLMTISKDDAELVSGPMQYPAVYRLYDNKYIPDIIVNFETINQK